MTNWLIQLQDHLGHTTFVAISILASMLLCIRLIPLTTDWMVNASAGLAGKYLGRKQRTLVINASTNNPEMFNMFVSFGLGRLGGLANPLGSNFANLYLMFFVAKAWVVFKWACQARWDRIRAFGALLKREKKLWSWHLGVAFILFVFGSLAYYFMTGIQPFEPALVEPVARTWPYILLGTLSCLLGLLLFRILEKRLKEERGDLYEHIDESAHHPSWTYFFLGTGGLILCCYILNAFFLAWTELYGDFMRNIFGSAIFAGLHYFLGALVTSLPELKVATDNFEHAVTAATDPTKASADLNTALSSASYSNMTNLAISALGGLLVTLLLALGVRFAL